MRLTRNLHDYLAEKIANGASRHLPASVTLLFDPGISEARAESFRYRLCTYLPGEFEEREKRAA